MRLTSLILRARANLAHKYLNTVIQKSPKSTTYDTTQSEIAQPETTTKSKEKYKRFLKNQKQLAKLKLRQGQIIENKNKIFKDILKEGPTAKNEERSEFKNTEKIEREESAYLKQLALKHRNESLDMNALALLEEFPYLNKSSTDPVHLSVIQNDFANKLAQIIHKDIYSNLQDNDNNNNKHVFIEYNPGFGLVTKNLLEIEKNHEKNQIKKYILFDKLKKYTTSLKSNEEFNKPNMKIYHNRNVFESDFLYEFNELRSQLAKFMMDSNGFSIYGILPWNCKGFLSSLYSSYISNRQLFSILKDKNDQNIFPNVYLYVPEFILGKLKPDLNETLKRVFKNSLLSTLANVFSDVKVLNENEDVNYFFPYPQISTPNRHPYNKINLKKMYLINIKFKNHENTNLFEHKRLYYLFLQQIYVRPTDSAQIALKRVASDVQRLCEHHGIPLYRPLNRLSPTNTVDIFESLMSNKKHKAYLENTLLRIDKSYVDKKFVPRSEQMKTLKQFNKDFTGRLFIPTITSTISDTFNKKILEN